LRLILAAGQGNVRVMHDLIKDGADVNMSDDLLGNPLGASAASARYEAVKLLVDGGANVNAVDGQGNTPLIWSAQSGNPEVVRLLLSKGADPNASNKKLSGNFTALAIAKFKKNEEIVKVLTEAGAK